MIEHVVHTSCQSFFDYAVAVAQSHVVSKENWRYWVFWVELYPNRCLFTVRRGVQQPAILNRKLEGKDIVWGVFDSTQDVYCTVVYLVFHTEDLQTLGHVKRCTLVVLNLQEVVDG